MALHSENKLHWSGPLATSHPVHPITLAQDFNSKPHVSETVTRLLLKACKLTVILYTVVVH